MSSWDAYKIVLSVDSNIHLEFPESFHKKIQVLALISAESHFNTGVIGDDGRSLGLMQVQWKYHKNIPKDKLRLDTSTNIKTGIACLKAVNWDVQAYNAGVRGARHGRGKNHKKKVYNETRRIFQWLTNNK